MKKTVFIYILLCVFSGMLNAQVNKMQNSGFETEFNLPKKDTYTYSNGQECDRWILACLENHGTYPSSGEINTVTTEKNSGNRSMEVKLEKIGARYTFFLLYDIKGLTPGKYTLTFYSKADANDVPFRIDAIACGGTDYKTEKPLLGDKDDVNGVYPDNQAGRMLKTSTTWQKHTVEFFASGLSAGDMGVVRLAIRPNCLKSGSSGIINTPVTYWFDDFELINENERPVESGYPTFAAISDIHINRGGNWETKINKTLPILANQNPKLDAIFITGDITHQGTQAEFDLTKQIITEQIPADIPVYYCMGNHDWWGSATEGGNMFVNTLGQPLNQYIKIKGYPFIMISMETKNESNAYGTKTRSFLSNALLTAAAEFPDKPIFVFMHIPNSNTVYGSFEIGGGDAWGTTNVQDILDNYPQVIAVSGHSHYFLADERSIHQDKFTSINDGSVSYAETEIGLEGGTRPKDGEKILEGCFISATENNDIVVKRWDFYNNKEIKQPWTIQAPHDGSKFIYKGRNGKSSPYFEASDNISVSTTGTNSCKIQFQAAKDDDVVQQYKIELLDENQQNTISVYKILSDFYLPTSDNTFTWQIAGLEANLSYYVRVTAIDAFGNKSEPLISEKFDLGVLSGISVIDSFQQFTVYPNPVKRGNTVCIATELSDEELDKATIDIYNASGILVQNAQLDNKNTLISMPVVSGIYIMKLNIDGISKDFKLLIE